MLFTKTPSRIWDTATCPWISVESNIQGSIFADSILYLWYKLHIPTATDLQSKISDAEKLTCPLHEFRESSDQFHTILTPEYWKLNFWVKLVGSFSLHPLGLLPSANPAQQGGQLGFKSRVRSKPANPKVGASNLLWPREDKMPMWNHSWISV